MDIKVKDIRKIQKQLGDNYFMIYYDDEKRYNSSKGFCVESKKNQNRNVEGWQLYKKDTTYKEIMTNKDNTTEELKEFVKTHYRYNFKNIILKVHLILAIILLIMTFINILFISSGALRYFIYGVEFMILLNGFILLRVDNRNWDADLVEFKDHQKELEEYRKSFFED